MKAIQVMFLIVVVLFSAALALILTRDRSEFDPDTFQPPAWLEALDGLAGGPRLDRKELTSGNRPFPGSLQLRSGRKASYIAAPGDERTRQVKFTIEPDRRVDVRIRFEPAPGQTVGDKQAQTQEWKRAEENSASASFIVYDRGGTFTFDNRSERTVVVRLEE